MKTFIALSAIALLCGCATTGLDPGGDVVQPYFWRSPKKVISAEHPKDGLEVRLSPINRDRALVIPTMGRSGMLALGEQSTQFLMDIEKNKALYTDALLNAFKHQNMDCEPTSATPYPTRFAFEFTYHCAP